MRVDFFADQMGMSPLSPTPMPMASTSASILNRPMSAMSQPTTTMMQSQGYHLPPGAMPLPGLASSGYPTSQQPHQTSASGYTANGYLNGPVSQSSPRMLNNADGYFYTQYRDQ